MTRARPVARWARIDVRPLIPSALVPARSTGPNCSECGERTSARLPGPVAKVNEDYLRGALQLRHRPGAGLIPPAVSAPRPALRWPGEPLLPTCGGGEGRREVFQKVVEAWRVGHGRPRYRQRLDYINHLPGPRSSNQLGRRGLAAILLPDPTDTGGGV